MEQSSRPTNNIYPDETDETTQLYDAYIEFINSSNTSIHTALDIIYNQQISFNQLLSTNRLRNINSASQFNTASNSIYQTNNPLRPISTQNRETFNQALPNISTFFPQRTNLAQYFTEFTNIPSTNIPSADIPSADERDAAIEYIIFSNINNALNTICPISHRDFSDNDTVIQLRECRHIFDASSILQWFTRNSRCPLCRNNIRANPELEVNIPTSNPIPFAQQLARLISDQLFDDRDFSGNLNIELAIPGRSTS